MQRLFFKLIGFLLLVKTCFSPKFKSLHPHFDFGDNLCQFVAGNLKEVTQDNLNAVFHRNMVL